MLLPLPLLLSGCQAINDAIVRQMHMDSGLSRRVDEQILEGLERRRTHEEPARPRFPAPPFMDQG